MNTKRILTSKTPAQAMVEFALVLPILLLLVYGVIEVGRLLFIYSSIVTSSRSAARYAATTGLNDAAITPRYQDCTGMRAAARRSAFIDSLADADIVIVHDEGEGLNPITYCSPGSATDASFTPSSGNTNRVRVTVSTQYSPIVPLVPFDAFTISSTSARTVLVSVPIAITAAPLGWNAPTNTLAPTPTTIPTNTLVPSATPTQFTLTPTVSPAVTYTPSNTPTLANTATPTLTPSPTNTPQPPGPFEKSSPANGATNQQTITNLTWTASTGATSYEVCYDVTNDNACATWSNVGLVTTYQASSLTAGVTYYWHVRASNSTGTTYSNGSTTAFWSFTITAPSVCDPRHSALKTSPFGMTIFNYSPTITIHISKITIYFNASGGQKAQSVTFGLAGSPVQIWSGNTGTPLSITSFSGDVSIGPYPANKILNVIFKDSYVINGNERITVEFSEAGCPPLDTDNPRFP